MSDDNASDGIIDPGVLQVDFEHAYGSHTATPLRESVSFGDAEGHYLIYPVGAQVAFRHIDTGEMNFIQQSDAVASVTSMAISRDKSLLAIAITATGEPPVAVTVYDLKSAGIKALRTLDVRA